MADCNQGDAFSLLDVTGLRCPLPVLKARRFLAALPPGSRAQVRADDPLARVDLAALCQKEGYRLLGEREEAGGVLVFDIDTGRV